MMIKKIAELKVDIDKDPYNDLIKNLEKSGYIIIEVSSVSYGTTYYDIAIKKEDEL